MSIFPLFAGMIAAGYASKLLVASMQGERKRSSMQAAAMAKQPDVNPINDTDTLYKSDPKQFRGKFNEEIDYIRDDYADGSEVWNELVSDQLVQHLQMRLGNEGLRPPVYQEFYQSEFDPLTGFGTANTHSAPGYEYQAVLLNAPRYYDMLY